MPRVLTGWPPCRGRAAGTCRVCVRNSSRSVSSSALDRLLEALGHQRLRRGGQLVDVVAEDRSVSCPRRRSSSMAVFVSAARRPLKMTASWWSRPVDAEVALDAMRLGSRMSISRSFLGVQRRCRSGRARPAPPSPEWMWHLAQTFLKISLPARVAVFSRPAAPRRLLAVGVWQPPPFASRPGPAGDGRRSGGRPGPASGRATARPRHLAVLDSAGRGRSSESVLPRQRRTIACPGGRRHRPHRVDEGRPDVSGIALRVTGGDQPVRQLGGCLRRHEGDHVAHHRGSALRRSISCRTAWIRAASACGGVGGGGKQVPGEFRRADSSQRPVSAPSETSAPTSRHESVESLGRKQAIAFPASASSRGTCPSASRSANPRDDRPGQGGVGLRDGRASSPPIVSTGPPRA